MDLEERSIDTEQVYDGVLLDVRRDRVRLPNGQESGREWIKHPGASAVVAVDDNDRVILIRQFRFGPKRVFWEVPAGKLDHGGEDPLVAAKRELAEEVGLEASSWKRIGTTYPAIGYSDEWIALFLARDLEAVEVHTDDDEFVEPFWLALEEAVRKAQRGEIEDAKSCVALLVAAAALEDERLHGG
ncbi:NUDIX domain-containing protein [Rubrivirga sp.]|uniref:NUDIX domain-containing protein n=1 Tax=Rubrivirga sp. TaxID=1885344 RepID=UPI003C78D504